MATLSVTDLIKRYSDQPIINRVNVDVEDGELIVVVGPSGCGKSTLLRMIAGLEEVSSGEIHINNRLVNRLEPKDRNIAMVFQNYALYPHMTVYKNMAYGLKRRALKKSEIDLRVQNTAEILGLKDLLYRKPAALSGGQRQRVAMGRAIVRKPDIFLFDEPLSNLDANLRGEMRLEIRRLQKRLGTTTLYVTHDQVEAMTLADRIVVMNRGEIEQIATPMEIYNKPASTFVAGFMGSPPMNFLSATISADGDAVVIHGGTKLPLTQSRPRSSVNQPVILGIRPESIIKATKEGADVFNLVVELVESLGAEKLVYGKFPGDNQTLRVRLPNKVQTSAGEKLRLGVMPDSLHLFELESKGRISGEQYERV